MGTISFITLKKTNAVIVKQPAVEIKKDQKGKVTSRRQIQYSENHDTIYVDEQKKLDPNVKPTPIYIQKGILTVDEEDIRKLEFLRATNQNESNGGKIFRELDIEKESLYQINKYEAYDQASKNIMKSNENIIRSIVAWFLQPHLLKTKSIKELRLILRTKVEDSKKLDSKHPNNFITAVNNFVKDKSNEHKLLIAVAVEQKIIDNVANGFVWSDTRELIYKAPQSENLVRSFADWLKNDEEGRTVATSISSKVKKVEQVKK